MDNSTTGFPEDLESFVDDETWTYAKTMPQWPHEYLVRERVDLTLFESTLKCSRKCSRLALKRSPYI